jgi:hypothetical protein
LIDVFFLSSTHTPGTGNSNRASCSHARSPTEPPRSPTEPPRP